MVKQLFWIGLVLLAIAMAFYALENAFFALVFFAAAIFIIIGTMLYRALKFSGKKAKDASKISEEIEKAEPQHPSQELIGSGLKELGKKTGEHFWEEKKVWTTSSKGSGVRQRLGKSSKTFIDKFFELFK